MTAKEIVAAALEIDPAARREYLQRACGDDQDLLREVQDVLNLSPVSHSSKGTVTIASMAHESASSALVIGPYKLLGQLGEGGMGVVYHARQDQPIRRDVALKIIKPGMDTRQVIARFESERQALALMDHPSIARVFDGGTTSTGLPYFVMERVDGAPIVQYCDSKRLSVTERIKLFILVCQAIQHAHQKGIIHRDIKPSNVLVTEQEGKPVPKVIDFGLAKALGPQLTEEATLTNVGTVLGTLEYMSPEQAKLGRHDIDTRADIYSLGAVLYELLSGTTPLEHEHMANADYIETLRRIREEEPPRPSARLRQSSKSADIAERRRTDAVRLTRILRGELDWIVMKALEKEPVRRYETVNGLVRDLQRYLEGEPVEAGPSSATYRMKKFLGKYRLWLAIAAAVTALLVFGIVASSWMTLRARRAEQVAQAVNSFLQNDLLAQASANNQARPGTKPDPDLKVRTALDRAAAQIEGKFPTQPVVEASIRQTIGETYRELGLYPDAQRQVERALDLRRRALGEQHPDTLKSMNDLTSLYIYQSEYALAEPLLRKLLEIRRHLLGEQHPDTLGSMSNMGMLYFYQGKYAQAEALYAKTLEVERRVTGEESHRTRTAMNGLASVYLYQGKYVQAEALYAKNLEILSRVVGEQHPYTLIEKANLAEAIRAQGKYAQAEALYTEVLETDHRALGEEHVATLFTENSLAELYRREGKYAQAEALFAKVLASRRRILGEVNPDTLSTLTSLGRVALQQQKYSQAELALREALKIYATSAPDTWERYSCESTLGAALVSQEKFGEAERLLLSSYEGLVRNENKIPAEYRSDLEHSKRSIVELYLGWGKPQKASEWSDKSRR
jgi:non-specific serine/threonine protein kinase/serine/threonine-protein kinase